MWAPLTPDCLARIDPGEQATVHSPDTDREIDLGPQSTPLETDAAKDPEPRGDDDQVFEPIHEQSGILTFPEPSWRH